MPMIDVSLFPFHPLIHPRRYIALVQLALGYETLDAAVGRAGAALAQCSKSVIPSVVEGSWHQLSA